MPSNEDLVKTFSETLVAEIKNVDETLLPLLKEYLNSVRGVRMSLANEVQDILKSTRHMMTLAKDVGDLKEFVDTLTRLRNILTPEFMEIINKLTIGNKNAQSK